MEGEAVDSYQLPIGTVLRKGVLPTALPFLLSSSGYFYSLLRVREDLSLENKSVLKCIPILLLAFLVVVLGRRSSYKFLVVIGLLMSSVGDFYLIWSDEENFMKGMAAFGLAHIFYITAFGFSGFAPLALIAACGMAGGASYLILPKLEGVLSKAVPVYIAVISLMLWRSLARLSHFYGWPCVAGVVGALLFVVSDFNLSLNTFYFDKPCRYGAILTMVTYYGGQLGIALSVIDRTKMVKAHMMSLEQKSKTS